MAEELTLEQRTEAARNSSYVPPKITPETVTVSKKDWDEVMSRLKLLEDGGIKKIPTIKERIARITLHKGKVVTEIVKTWTERKFGEVNKRDEDRLYAEIKTEDGNTYTLDFLDFLNNSEKIICAVKKIDKKDISIDHGKFETQKLDEKNVKKFRPEELSDIENKTDDDYTLEFLESERKGEKLVLNHKALNL